MSSKTYTKLNDEDEKNIAEKRKNRHGNLRTRSQTNQKIL